MRRSYTATLRLSAEINYYSLRTGLAPYMHEQGWFVPQKTEVGGTNLFLYTQDDDCIWFARNNLNFCASLPVQDLEAIKAVLEWAKKIEELMPTFLSGFRFDPNFIGLAAPLNIGVECFTGELLEPNAILLQKTLYRGGDAARVEEPAIFLGTETEKIIEEGRGYIRIPIEGTAQPAQSLDELLQRIGNAPKNV